jgi:acetyltransferase-like isoleucine patch superfamily enzyme
MFNLLKKTYKFYNLSISIVYTAFFRLLGVRLGDKNRFIGMPHIFARSRGLIKVGSKCKIVSGETANPVGLHHRCIIRTLTTSAKITIGDNVGMSGTTLLARKSITVGDNVLFGANCTVIDSDHHQIDPTSRLNDDVAKIISKSVVIENNVWLGGSVMVLKGVTIGRNSVVGAGSIVTADVPSNVLVAGNPAKIIRKI